LFLGWSLSNDGDVAFFDGEEIFINFEDTLTLYAVWRDQPGTMWWIWLVVGFVSALGIAVVVVVIIRKRRKDRAKIMSKQ
jgi:flagellar biosynthesis/type III secretory pathway M-ring protein FliF/YscJ